MDTLPTDTDPLLTPTEVRDLVCDTLKISHTTYYMYYFSIFDPHFKFYGVGAGSLRTKRIWKTTAYDVMNRIIANPITIPT